MVSLYLLGVVAAAVVALVLKRTAFKGEPVPFIMELPNYRLPSAKTTVMLAWDKAKDFIQRAFTIIFAASIVVWFLQTFDGQLNVVADQSRASLRVSAASSRPCSRRSALAIGAPRRRS